MFCNTWWNRNITRYILITGNIRGTKVDDFGPLEHMKNLRGVRFEDPINQKQLESISGNRAIVRLSISHSGKLESLEPLSKMTQLTHLTLSTPMGWITKKHYFPTFKPLSKLVNLKHLDMIGIAEEADRQRSLKK